MIRFRYDQSILDRFPGLFGGVGLARGLRGGPVPPALEKAYGREQAATLDRIGARPLAELESLAAWRQAFRAFGVDPTQHRSAAEALLRRLTKKGGLPSVNLLVDIGNLVSIRYAVPVAVLDTRGLTGAVTVRFAEGREPFTELDSDEVKHPEPGEVVFVDKAGVVCARRWCWRQSAQSAARESTTEALITVEGHHGSAEADVGAALRDLAVLLAEFAGGKSDFEVLSIGNPEFRAA
jgi:DNA/RNA-binding domain of Phe-tRNA-synthetase-like protein